MDNNTIFQHTDITCFVYFSFPFRIADIWNDNISTENQNMVIYRNSSKNPEDFFSPYLALADEATPHLHIDFVPFTTGSKRGLDTRVSLKQALAAQRFKGGSRGDTEWSQWVQTEKSSLPP